MAEEVILKVGVEGTGDGETKIKSLKTQLKELKNELSTLDEKDPKFKKLSREAGELQDRIGDVNDKVKALASDTKRLDALVGVGSAIAGGFQAAQGAMALFGSDSEKVTKAIQNVIAVQGILNGVQQVGQFITAKGIVQDGIASAALVAKTGVLKAVTAAQWLWNAAITANPIGLIIAGVAALTGGIYLLIKGLKDGTISIKDLTKWILYAINPLTALYELYKLFWGEEAEANKEREREAKRRAEETAKETAAHKERLKQIREERDARIAAADKNIKALELEKNTLEANGESSAAVTQKILEAELEKTKAVLDGNTQRLQSWITYYTNLALINGQSEEEFKAQMKGRGIDLDSLHEQALAQIQENQNAVQYAENAITKFKREQGEARSEEAQKEADRLKAIADKERADAEKAAQDQLELDRENYEAYQDLIKNRKQFLIDEEQRRLDAEFDLMEAQIDRENAARDQQEQLENERRARNLKSAENFANTSINLVNTVFALTNKLGKQDEEGKEKRAKRQFQINKALQLGLAVMDGYKAITASLAQAPVAIGPIPNPAGIASLAFAATTAALNIAKIASATYGGSGSSSTGTTAPNIGSATEGAGNTTPNITPIQAGSTFLNPEPQKVFVVESDITDTQKGVKAIVAEATF